VSFEDLKEHDAFLPEEAWGKDDLHTRVSQPALLLLALLGAAAIGMMVLGDGGTLTWVGAVLFGLFMWLFAAVSSAGVDAQADHVQALSEQALSEQALSEQALSDQALSDQALSDQAGRQQADPGSHEGGP